ncbi:MAG: hypothetical protein ACKVQR_03160, partial [Aquabacterium sp.]
MSATFSGGGWPAALGLLGTMALAATPARATTTPAPAVEARWAVVTQDATPLRAGPRDSAAQQAVLWPGDLVEWRGVRLDHVQVWDHRRERAGFIRAGQLRIMPLGDPAAAPELKAVLRFLRDQPGVESLGIAYAAAYLKAAPALDAEAFDAIGQMAERLGRRAGQRQAGAATAAQLEVVAGYGVRFQPVERDGTITLCSDGAADR